jgi:hypothetical protein
MLSQHDTKEMQLLITRCLRLTDRNGAGIQAEKTRLDAFHSRL